MPHKLKTLLQMLSDGHYHSGTALGKSLQLTRGAVWEIIKKIKNHGIKVEAKTNLGYKIPQGLELLEKPLIMRQIKSQHRAALKELVIVDELSSTNDYLAALINKKKTPVKVCLAEYQTAGKGRLGRKWVSPFAQNIYLSLLWQFSRTPNELSSLGLVVAIAIIEALNNYGIKQDLGLKWPNDVLWQRRKLAGVLIEVFGETNYIYNTVIGVGLNVKMSPAAGKKIDQPWCDIAQITNTLPRRNQLAGLLLEHLLTTITLYQQEGLKPLLPKWNKLDLTYGQQVTLITPQHTISGIGCGINEQGQFLLKDNYNNIHHFASGEVSLRY